MKFIIKHEIEGRIRVHFAQNRMTYVEADALLYYLENLEFVKKAKGLRADSGRRYRIRRGKRECR